MAIYTTQTEFTRNTTLAAVEQAWEDSSLSNEEVATKLNTTWHVLKETKRKNKRFAKVMVSERSKGLSGYIINPNLAEEVSDNVEQETVTTPQSTVYSFRQITRDGEQVIKLDIVDGQVSIDDITKQLSEKGMSITKGMEFVVTGFQIPVTPAEVLSGVATDFTVRQQVSGG